MNGYVLIGVLIFVILVLLSLVIYLHIRNTQKDSDWNKRLITLDRHHTAKERFLTFLLLESKGLNTGVGSTPALYRQYLAELQKDNLLDKFEETFVSEESSKPEEE